MLHAGQQAGQVVLIARAMSIHAIQLARQRRIDDWGLDGGGLDVDSLQFAGCGSPGSAGVIGGVGQIDGVELVLVFGYALTVSPLANLHLTGRNAVCTDRNGGGVQQRVSRSTLAVEVDKTGGDSGGPGSRILDGRGQRDLLALELSEMRIGEDVACTVDRHICGFIISAGDFQRGGGLLKINCRGRFGDQHGFILVVHQSAVGSVLRGLGEVAGRAGDRRYDRAEHILGIGRVDRSGIAGAGVGVIRPDALIIAILPRDRVVLVHGQLGVLLIERVNRGQFQRVDLTGDHGGDRIAVLIRDGQNIGVGVDLGGRIQLPADGGGHDLDVLRGARDLGIAVALGGDEDGLIGVGVRAVVHKAAGLGRVDGGAAADDRALEQLPVGAAVRRTVELHRAGGDGSTAGLDRRGQRDILALVLLSLVDFQLDARLLGLPDGVEDGVRSEIGNIRSCRISLFRVRVRGDSGVVGLSPAEEVVARALRLGLADLDVVRVVEQVVVDRFLHRAAVTAVIIINDRHGFALDADDGDLGVLLRGELEGVGITVDLLGGEQLVVDTDLHLRCVVARGNRDGEGHGGAVVDGAGAGQRCRCARLGALHFDGVAVGCRRCLPSDDRLDGRQLGVDGGVLGHGIRQDGRSTCRCGYIDKVPRVIASRFLIPAAERVALDHGVDRAGRLFVITNLLRLVDAAVGHERHGVDRVGSNVNIDCNILRDVRQRIVIFLRSVLIDRWSPIAQRLPAIDAIGVLPDLRLIFRVITVDDQVEIEISSVRNGHGSVSVVERIALAAAERDRVGLLLPHGVEGDILIHGIHITGLIAGGGGGFRRAPAEEGVALAGGDGIAQLCRGAVGLGLSGDGSGSCGVAVAVQVIRDGIGLGRQLGIDHGICRNVCQRGWRYTVLTGIPAVEAIPFDFRCVHRTVTAVLNILHVVGTVVYDVSDLVEPNRFHIDGHGLVGLNFTNSVRAVRCVDLHAVRIHAFDGVARARGDGERHAIVILHRSALTANRSRR